MITFIFKCNMILYKNYEIKKEIYILDMNNIY